MTLLLDTLYYSCAAAIALWALASLLGFMLILSRRDPTHVYDHANLLQVTAVIYLLLFFLLKPFATGYISPL